MEWASFAYETGPFHSISGREGFCQLNKPEKSSKSAQCTRSGIMFGISSINCDTKYYFLRINPGDSTNTEATRNFLQYLLSSPFRKICYEAQEMYSYLIDMFHFPARQVCLTWLLLDPLVGSWLLDPDQPIHTFSEAIDRFGVKPAVSYDLVIKEKDNFSQSCQLLGVLSLVVEKLYHNLSSQKLWKLFIDMEMRLVPLLA
ncbi:unnamed protein product, partial [Timema podura]|nr:unnamed protein product [Timema podura]